MKNLLHYHLTYLDWYFSYGYVNFKNIKKCLSNKLIIIIFKLYFSYPLFKSFKNLNFLIFQIN